MPRRSLAALLLVTSFAAAAAAQDAARFDRERLPAVGRQAALLTIPGFGRYSVSVESTQGTALQLADRMAGPGEVAGKVAEEDGRLDAFLDRGDYKVLTFGHEKATGEVKLQVHSFEEQNPDPIQLVEHRLVSGRLGDFAQLSYWLDVKERRRVIFEAAGRHLRDLRLWHGGAWLVDAKPIRQVVEPRTGQPLLLCQLTADLPPGLYRLTAYGGPSQPWAEESGEQPFYLRFGIPMVAEASRRRLEVSPFGFDHFLVPCGADYFRLELPEPRPAFLEVGVFDPDRPFAGYQARVQVEKESVPPVAELRQGANPDGQKLVTVRSEAGQPYLLQHFAVHSRYVFKEAGDFWVSTIHSGHPDDSIDATALLVRRRTKWPEPVRPMRTQVVEVGHGKTWARRANLLDTLTVYLRITETGSYEVLGSGADARLRIEPFFVTSPPNYEPPPMKEAGSVWDLDEGFYVLTVKPEKKGILEIAIRPRGWLDAIKQVAGLDQEPTAEPPRASIRFEPVHITEPGAYELYLNRQPEVTAGFVVRRVPLDLAAEALPLTQRPDEVVRVPVRSEERSLLRAVAEDGSRLDVSVDGGEWSPEAWLGQGTYQVGVRWRGTGNVVYTLGLVPERLLAESSLPPVPRETLDALPDFPVLTDREKRYFDLERQATATWLVDAGEPALYRLETTGLLATEGNLRTRVVTSLVRQSENGVGRNFLVQQYLREGDYQISVAARGKSAGHLGLQLRRTEIHDGGLLSDGIPARGYLPAGEAIAYRLRIDEPGRYRLRSIGVGRTFRARLEDDEGWPLMSPSVEADLTRDFESGEYRMIVLPESVPARQLTLLERVREPLHYEGHGPHELVVGPARLQHRWHESGEGEKRRPDVFRFHLPARADVTVTLTDEMQADVYRVGGDKVAYVPPERNFTSPLEAGEYELRVTSFRVNNQVDYTVGVETRQLVAGQSRDVEVPGWVPLAVGEGRRLAELSSFGSADVRARLVDGNGNPVASSDDRPGDWNFLLTERLDAGDYWLRVDPVGTARTRTTVTLTHPEEREGETLLVPGDVELDPGRAVTVHALEVAPEAEALVLAAASAENVGLSLERADADAWHTVATRIGRDARIEMPLPAGGSNRYRLRLWSLDQRGNPVRLRTAAGALQHVREAELAKGVRLEPLGGLDAAFVAVDLDRPGCFELSSEDGVRFAGSAGQVTAPVEGPVPADGGRLYLAAELGTPGRRLQGRRLVLAADGKPVLVQLPAGRRVTCDVEAGDAAVVVEARSVVGSPGLAVDGAPVPPAVASHAALAVGLGAPSPTAAAWSGEGSSALELRLRAWSFSLPEAEEASWGFLEGDLAGAVRAFDLPAGEKRLRLVLAPSVVAALADGDRVTSVHWADAETGEEVLETSSTRLVFFRLGETGRFRADVLPVDERRRLGTIQPGRPFERHLERAGTLRLPIAPVGAEGVRLRVWGAEESTLLGADGSIVRGADFAVPPDGGTLLVHHRPPRQEAWVEVPGTVIVYFERPGQESEDLWASPRAEPRRVELPAVETLDGELAAFELPGEAPRVLHLRSPAPLVVRLETPDGAARTGIHPGSTAVDYYLPAGTTRLDLRAVGGGRLDATLELRTSPIVEIGEGLGPEIQLAAGETRFFAFHVAEAGSVGLGVRADADVVETALLDATGSPLGSGVVQMHQLEPGSYLLVLGSPAGSPPLSARPIVVGLERPSTGPPAEVVRGYLEMARGGEG